MVIQLWKCSWRWLWQSRWRLSFNIKVFYVDDADKLTNTHLCDSIVTIPSRLAPLPTRTQRQRWSIASCRSLRGRNRRSWPLRATWQQRPPSRPSQRATACCCLSLPVWTHSKRLEELFYAHDLTQIHFSAVQIKNHLLHWTNVQHFGTFYFLCYDR